MYIFLVSQTKPNRSEIRIPTSVWSGYGFSQSSPSSILKEQRDVIFNSSSITIILFILIY